MDADVPGLPDDVMGDGALDHLLQARLGGLADDDMRRIVGLGVTDGFAGHVATRDRDCLAAKALGKAQRLVDPVARGVGTTEGRCRLHVQHRPGRLKPFGHAAGIADQCLAAGGIVDADQDALPGGPRSRDRVGLHVVQELRIHALGRAPKGELPQGRQVAGREVVGHGALGGLGHIDLALVQSLDQVLGRDVDHLDIVGPLQDRIRHGLPHADAGDLRHHVVQALDMLNVHRGEHVDAGREQFLHIHVAFGMAAALGIGVGQLVDEDERGPAPQDRVEVHLLETVPLVVENPPRHDLEPFDQRLGFPAAVGLDDADDDIKPSCLLAAASCKHLVGLAHARSGAEEDSSGVPCPPGGPHAAVRPARAAGRRGFGRLAWNPMSARRPASGRPRALRYPLARSRARFSLRTFTRGSPRKPSSLSSVCSLTNRRTRSSGRPRAVATRGTWNRAASGEMWGSRPLPEVVTRSIGHGLSRVLALAGFHVALDAVDQGLVGGCEVRAAGVRRIVGHRGRLARVCRIRARPSPRAGHGSSGRP